ncbi:alkaline phosphatase [Paramesorhizobium deserti]|uniref:Alkaline phosphatase n=1 Tax=Paramesorhizobium deserti TaxID=1494590 RepID=A0A135HV84_9HYPH|nr:alkaline phosphatase [Paramesorhizobium deserti]KXF77123.1 alkaline phosphatase [Paramesorhizobium deserti]
MPKHFTPLLLATVVFSAHAGAAHAQTADADVIFQRPATGELSEAGGARRLKGDITAAFRDQIRPGPAKNVILLIGDGMGDSEITIARDYAVGAGNFFKGLDALPVTGQYTHYSLDRETGKPTYVTDSAASATAWASGVKTYNGAIGVDIHGEPHKTLLELAKQAGLATGNVSTAEIQDATPAAEVAHVTHRKCYAPTDTAEKCPGDALENGGLGSISEQLLDHRADVTLGGGARHFEDKARAGEWKGQTLLTQAEARGYRLVANREELDNVTIADQDRPLLGLFATGNLPVIWEGPQASRNGNIEKEPVECRPNEKRPPDLPTLAQMTGKAIELLKINEKGLFLQVESASIDKQDHVANPCGQIGETVALDEAVQVALDFAREDGNTLVIVTADHAHASQIIDPDVRVPGLSQALRTKDGAIMAISYATSDEPDHQNHTGTQLRVAAYGPGAANFTGLTDQTDMFYTIRDVLGIQDKSGVAAKLR